VCVAGPTVASAAALWRGRRERWQGETTNQPTLDPLKYIDESLYSRPEQGAVTSRITMRGKIPENRTANTRARCPQRAERFEGRAQQPSSSAGKKWLTAWTIRSPIAAAGGGDGPVGRDTQRWTADESVRLTPGGRPVSRLGGGVAYARSRHGAASTDRDEALRGEAARCVVDGARGAVAGRAAAAVAPGTGDLRQGCPFAWTRWAPAVMVCIRAVARAAVLPRPRTDPPRHQNRRCPAPPGRPSGSNETGRAGGSGGCSPPRRLATRRAASRRSPPCRAAGRRSPPCRAADAVSSPGVVWRAGCGRVPDANKK